MLDQLTSFVPSVALEMALVLALALLIGLEREERKQREGALVFGGVRTFPLIGLVSYTLSLLSTPQLLPWAIGFGVVGGFMLLSYQRKLSGESPAGFTTEITGLATYVMGGLVQHDRYWVATTLAVLSVLLLELKKGLEGLTKRVASAEIVTVAKFLMLAAVILPIVPNRELTRFAINPFKTWLVVVAVSGVSFASYAVQGWLKGRGGLLLSAVLGGAYSSTVTTVVLARQARQVARVNLYSGSILVTSGVMYGRLVLLVAFFNRTLALRLAAPFLTLGVAAGTLGWLIARRRSGADQAPEPPREATNPLELKAAVLFAAVFVVVLVVTKLVRDHMGHAGLYSLAAIMGVTDVDPFILGLTQTAPATTSAAVAIVIAAASNNVVKGVYAFSFADRETGKRSLVLLLGLAALGLAPLLWL